MYHPSTNWVEQTKFVVREMLNSKVFVLEGVITSVDPNPPFKVRARLMPYGIETGWLQVASPLCGHGFGLLLPPPEEGVAVKVIFDMGDIQNGTVVGAVQHHVAPPAGHAGTFGLVHASGSAILINTDGAVTIKGSSVTIEGDLRTQSSTTT